MVNTQPEQTTEEIIFHTPGRLAGALPYALQVAGLGIAYPAQEPVRKRYHDHVLLFALAGQGRVEIGGAVHVVEPGEVLWLDTSRPYAHGAAGAASWRYLWMGLRGTGLDGLHGLLDVSRQPLFRPEPAHDLETVFREVCALAGNPAPEADARANAAVAAILAVLAGARDGGLSGLQHSPQMARIAELLRQDLARAWTIEDLARLAGLSASQLFRAFKAASGSTPMSYLRQERIAEARCLLTATNDPVAVIARRCGYADPYHFSRDFRRLTGTTPTLLRRSTGF
ncbi:helix-turn-helix transcriptional regulator [Pannonibacter carbonis]|uniref:helix-turn-helix transcriptional regulator n=1 Tax=Pannonibacter carbonis TaxID=2067569 RepID=UPI0018E55DC4|nr:AraC family transcriptional regulator [Pannonibacter carbonis]